MCLFGLSEIGDPILFSSGAGIPYLSRIPFCGAKQLFLRLGEKTTTHAKTYVVHGKTFTHEETSTAHEKTSIHEKTSTHEKTSLYSAHGKTSTHEESSVHEDEKTPTYLGRGLFGSSHEDPTQLVDAYRI